MLSIITEFESDFHRASLNYFYLTEITSNRIQILQNSGFLNSLIVDPKQFLTTLIEQGFESFEFDTGPFENWEGDEIDYDNPPRLASDVSIEFKGGVSYYENGTYAHTLDPFDPYGNPNKPKGGSAGFSINGAISWVGDKLGC